MGIIVAIIVTIWWIQVCKLLSENNIFNILLAKIMVKCGFRLSVEFVKNLQGCILDRLLIILSKEIREGVRESFCKRKGY